MIAIYKSSWGCLLSLWPLCLGFIAISIALVEGIGGPATGLLIPLQILITYPMHRYFLGVQTPGQKIPPAHRPIRFLLFSILIFVLPIALATGCAILIPALWNNMPALSAATLVLYLAEASLFGTILPAAVEGWRPGYKLSRAMLLAPGVLGRLLIGPGLVILLGIGLFFALALLPIVLTDNHEIMRGPVGHILLAIEYQTVNFCATTVVVAVLCDTYRRIIASATAPR